MIEYPDLPLQTRNSTRGSLCRYSDVLCMYTSPTTIVSGSMMLRLPQTIMWGSPPGETVARTFEVCGCLIRRITGSVRATMLSPHSVSAFLRLQIARMTSHTAEAAMT